MADRTGWMAVAVLGGVLSACPALALEPRQCLPMAEMNRALKLENQRSLIIGDRKAVVDDASRAAGARVDRYANAFVSNADGSIGYQLEGDLPRVIASTKMCVAAKLTNIRLFDARIAGIAHGALLGGAFDDVVRDKESVGTRPMVIADTVYRSADGSTRLGLPMILFGNIAGRSASLYTILPNGRPEALLLMGDTDYTPVAIERLDGAAK